VSVQSAQAAIAAALEPLAAEIPELQVYGYRNPAPSPPSIDVYPATPFQVGAGMGVREKRVFFTVRARVTQADPETQILLLRMLDPDDPASVEQALDAADAAFISNEGEVGGFQDYPDGLLGCEWRVEVFT
jgi:hypothetical protein